MASVINKDGYEFLECIPLNEYELVNFGPLAGSYAVVKFDGKYLICFNTWRKIKYNPIYYAELEYIVPFQENDETDKIIFWNLIDDVGYMDEVDAAVLNWCKSLS